MAEIKNPRHSRPLDVHRWSEHPEVKGLVDKIWDEYVEETVPEKVRGPKPKLAYRKQLRVIILDLYVAWLDGFPLFAAGARFKGLRAKKLPPTSLGVQFAPVCYFRHLHNLPTSFYGLSSP